MKILPVFWQMRHSRISYRCAVLRTSWLGCALTGTASAWQGELHLMGPVDLACNEIIPQDRANCWKFLENCGNESFSVPVRKSACCSKMKILIAGTLLGMNRGEVTCSDIFYFVSHCGLQHC
jgi:hypothetical protein